MKILLITSFWGCEKESLVNELPQNQLNTTSKKIDVESIPTLERFVLNLKKGSDPKLKSRFSPENIQIESSILYRDLTNRLNLYSFLIEDNEFHSIYNLVVETDARNTEIISSYIMRYEMTDEFAKRFYSRQGASFINFEGTVSKYLYATLFNNTNTANREGDLEACWELVIEINYGTGSGTGSGGGGGHYPGGTSGNNGGFFTGCCNSIPGGGVIFGGNGGTGNGGNGDNGGSSDDDDDDDDDGGEIPFAREGVTLADCKPILECVGVYIDKDGTIIEDTSGWDINGPPSTNTLAETIADVLNLDEETEECLANSGKKVQMMVMNMMDNGDTHSCDSNMTEEEIMNNILSNACGSGEGLNMDTFKAALNEEDIITIDDSLDGCPLAKCLIETLMTGSNDGPTLFCTTAGNFMDTPYYNLAFTMAQNSGDIYGSDGNTTTPDPNTGKITIRINEIGCEDHPLKMAGTILHEAIHAEMYRACLEAGLPPTSPDSYEQIWNINLNLSGGSVGTAQHQIMANQYVDAIANALMQLDGGQFPVEYYMYIAWDGLRIYGVYPPDNNFLELYKDLLNTNNTAC